MSALSAMLRAHHPPCCARIIHHAARAVFTMLRAHYPPHYELVLGLMISCGYITARVFTCRLVAVM